MRISVDDTAELWQVHCEATRLFLVLEQQTMRTFADDTPEEQKSQFQNFQGPMTQAQHWLSVLMELQSVRTFADDSLE